MTPLGGQQLAQLYEVYRNLLREAEAQAQAHTKSPEDIPEPRGSFIG